MSEENNESKEKDGTSPMMMDLPSSLGKIDTDDISLPLSLIKGLRRKSLDTSMANTSAMDSSTSSNSTSDKDDSGGDEEGGSNTSSTGKPTLSVGQISSLSGSEQEGANRGPVGILRVGGTITNASGGFSSSSDENITGDDELSEKVVVRGKSASSSQQQQDQVQYKVSFAEGHCSTKIKTGDSDAEQEEAALSKRKASSASAAAALRPDEKKSAKRQRTEPEELKNNSMAFSVSDSSGNEGNNGANANEKNQHDQQRNGGAPTRAVSSSSSTTESGQDPGNQASSSSLFSQIDDPMEQVKATTTSNKSDTSMSSPQLTSTTDPSKLTMVKSPTSPSKEQLFQDSEERRRERNQREKERSNKIASQVDTLRFLLQRGGLFIPKKTKSSVLSEASNYIKTLQDRQEIMSIEMDGLKRQLVAAVAARSQQQMQVTAQEQGGDAIQDYQLIFRNTVAGMCVVSMGGALLDCNAAFERETGFSQAKLGEMTIFNMIHANDLQRALDRISRMIDTGYVHAGCQASAPQAQQGADEQEPLLLQSSFPSRSHLGLCVMLVRGSDGLPKCFNVTLVRNVGNTSNNGSPVPFNPALPSIPSMPIETKYGGAPMPQQANVQQFSAHTQAPTFLAPTFPANHNAGPSGNGMMLNETPMASVANSAQGHHAPGIALPQAPAASQASLPVPQTGSNVPPQQLLQLLLLQQMQNQGHQPQQTAVAQQQQVPAVQQHLSQLNPALPALPPVNTGVNPSWDAQNIAMLPQIQQILKPPGSNSSPQVSDHGENDGGQSRAYVQNQAAPLPAGYLNSQNVPMLPQIQQMLKPPNSTNGSSQGSKNSGDEGDNRPWYYAG